MNFILHCSFLQPKKKKAKLEVRQNRAEPETGKFDVTNLVMVMMMILNLGVIFQAVKIFCFQKNYITHLF